MPRKRQDRSVAMARQLRSAMSLPEVLLWQVLRQRTDQMKFRRQHPIGVYVLDFYCPSARICVEIDGFSHETGDRPMRDEKRQDWLAQQGIETIRIPAVDVLKSPSAVADAIVRHCKRA